MNRPISSAIAVLSKLLLEKLLTVFWSAASFIASQLLIFKHRKEEPKELLKINEKL